MKQCLVTGASGFIGRSVCRRLAADFEVVTVGRSPRPHKRHAVVPDLASFAEWPSLLSGTDVVVHCAGRAHVKGAGDEALALHRAVNVEGTRRLAECAALAGVRRFVFISSIGVNGNRSLQPFTEQDVASPQEPYAVSKREAEQVLWQIHEAHPEMEVVVIRPPLVYGPAAPGNFGSLVRAIQRGLPLPLGAVHNRRTLIARDNLADLVACCALHPKAANELFLAGDGADISTTDLLRKMGEASGKRANLIPVPVSWLRGIAALIGRGAVVDKLCGNLQVDTTKARRLLGWSAPLTLDAGLQRAFAPDETAEWGKS